MYKDFAADPMKFVFSENNETILEE